MSENLGMKEVKVSDNENLFPTRKSIPVLGESPVQIENFNKLFLSELRENSGLELGLKLQVPTDALHRLEMIVWEILMGEIDNEPLKYQMVILAQTSKLNSTGWKNFKVALNTLLNKFQMLPQVAEILKEFVGTDQERLYAQNRICVKAIFYQALMQL